MAKKAEEFTVVNRPLYDTEAAIKIYSEKDGVDIKYVCTSALGEQENFARDIFFRETPHPEFGNRYFGLFVHPITRLSMIGNADAIEERTFEMIKGENGWEYSRHRHDFYDVPSARVAIDGGRAYFRMVGEGVSDYDSLERATFKIKDGEFVQL